MDDSTLPMLLLRVQQLQAQYLQQADFFTPTADHVADWLGRMHGRDLPAVDPATIPEGLPTQLLALPLFRHYLVSQLSGTVRDFIHERLSPEEQPLFARLKMPAHEFSQVLHEWNDWLWHLLQNSYGRDLVHLNLPVEHAHKYQVSNVISGGGALMAMQFMTLCVLPPYGVENRKMLQLGGQLGGFPYFPSITVEAYPTMTSEYLLSDRIWELQPEDFSEAEAKAALKEFGDVLRSEGKVWVRKPAPLQEVNWHL